MLDEILLDAKESMAKSIESFKRDLAKFRTGRASLTLLDGIRVEYYGTLTPLNQVAALKVVDPRLITVKPWDKGLLTEIEKAIVGGNIGVTPSSDGEIIRLPIPPLTGERRRDLVKQLKKRTEESRVTVRNLRRDANSMIKELDGVSEDAQHRTLDKVQELTNGTIKRLDEVAEKKEEEIMEV